MSMPHDESDDTKHPTAAEAGEQGEGKVVLRLGISHGDQRARLCVLKLH